MILKDQLYLLGKLVARDEQEDVWMLEVGLPID